MGHIRLFERAKYRPVATLTPLTIAGDLPHTAAEVAYEGRIPFFGEIGDVSVEWLTGELPPGATVTVDNATDEVVVAWPAYSIEDDEVPVPIENADFSGAGGWQLGRGWSISGGVAYFLAHGESSIVSDTLAPVTAGRSITLSCDVYQGASSSNNCGGAVRLAWFNAAREWLYNSEGNVIRTSEGPTLSTVTAAAPVDGFVAAVGWAFRRKQNKEMHLDNFSWNHTYTKGANADQVYCITLRIMDSAGRPADWAGCVEVIENPILADAPELYLRLTETSGPVLDSSGHGRHGTISGTPGRSAAGLHMTSNSDGVLLDAIHQALSVTHNTSCAFEAVITRDSAGGPSLEQIFCNTFSANNGYAAASLAIRGTGIADAGKATAGFATSPPLSIHDIRSPSTIPLATRLHLMEVRTPGVSGNMDVRLYINGAQVAVDTVSSEALVSSGTTSLKFRVGGADGGNPGVYFPDSYYFRGTAEGIAVYSHSITPERVLKRAQFYGLA